jgi:hypothetical protein
MANFGIITTGAQVFSRVAESADPVDLALRVNAALDELALITVEVAPDIFQPLFVSNMELAGGGDGHTFVVSITAAPFVGGGPGGLLPGEIRAACFLASEAEAIVLARAAAIAAMPAPPVTIIDELLAGASKGTRFMGLFITSLESPTELELLVDSTLYTYALGAEADFIPVPIVAPAVPVIVPGPYVLSGSTGLFAEVAPGHLTYIGQKVFNGNVRVRMSVRSSVAGPVVARGGRLAGTPPTAFSQSQTISIDNVEFEELSSETVNVNFDPTSPAQIAVGLANDTTADGLEVLAVEVVIQPIR